MRFSTLAVAAFAGLAAAAPAMLEERAGTCTNPLQRKEWRDMNVLEKCEYLIRRLMTQVIMVNELHADIKFST